MELKIEHLHKRFKDKIAVDDSNQQQKSRARQRRAEKFQRLKNKIIHTISP